MKREGKNTKKKDVVVNNYANRKKIMSSNLPLLFANGRPRSLETISQPELEEFVPFMILCSLGQELHKKPKEINKCPVPEWWPQGFPFKFPLVDQNVYINRQVMLKSLVCRCYTFYDCEFLLKFSSELAEMSPSHLRYEDNKGENTTSIYDASGCMLVKCRNENLRYDMHKNRRRYLSPPHRPTLSQTKKFDSSFIDLTFDTSSEDEKEVYFKEAPPRKAGKRSSIEICEEPPVKKCVRRVFYDCPKEEEKEPSVYTQEQFMAKFQLIPRGEKILPEVLKVDRKKRLAHSFALLSISSKRGQELLERNKHSFNLEASLERIERYCGINKQEEPESNQVCTRASVVFSAMYREDGNQVDPVESKPRIVTEKQLKWCHSYKWPHRTRNPYYPHRGPSIKPCSVVLTVLSEDTINQHTKGKRTISTMTPVKWWSGKTQICACQKIPLIVLDDEVTSKYKNKSSSTSCTCTKPKAHSNAATNLNKEIKQVQEVIKMSTIPETVTKARQRTPSDNLIQGSGGFHVSGSSLARNSPIHSVSFDKDGLGMISYNSLRSGVSSLTFKKSFQRKPLAVVPPTPIAHAKGITDVLCQSVSFLHQDTAPRSSVKINFNRSILDAIKWYTKDDPVSLSDCFAKEENKLFGVDSSQENIKPLTELVLPNSKKYIDYFQKNGNISERDYCFKRSSDGTSKLVTRRGERHYTNREPCPSCFQGRDNFCVYEFIRQAKLAGLALHKNQKQLQLIFLKLIQAVSSTG